MFLYFFDFKKNELQAKIVFRTRNSFYLFEKFREKINYFTFKW
jgi:hypothetical protein